MMCLISVLCFFLLRLTLSLGQTVVIVPDSNAYVVSVDQNRNVTLTWKITPADIFNPSEPGSRLVFRVPSTKHDVAISFDLKTLIWKNHYGNTEKLAGDKLALTEYGIVVKNTGFTDRGRYSCQYQSDKINTKDVGIQLHVYEDRKTPPIVVGGQPHLGSTLTLTCDPRRFYIPDDKRLPLRFKWYNNGSLTNVTASSLRVSDEITMRDDGDSYQCTIEEYDSNVTSNISEPFVINLKRHWAVPTSIAIVGFCIFALLTLVTICWHRKIRNGEKRKLRFLQSRLPSPTNIPCTLQTSGNSNRVTTRDQGFTAACEQRNRYESVSIDDVVYDEMSMPAGLLKPQNGTMNAYHTINDEDVRPKPIVDGGDYSDICPKSTLEKIHKYGFAKIASSTMKIKQKIRLSRDYPSVCQRVGRKVALSPVAMVLSEDDVRGCMSGVKCARKVNPKNESARSQSRWSVYSMEKDYEYMKTPNTWPDACVVSDNTPETYTDHTMIDNDVYDDQTDVYAEVKKPKRPRRNTPRRPIPAAKPTILRS